MSAFSSVAVVDANASTRRALHRSLEDDGFKVVGEASDADGAIEVCRRFTPGVVILDVDVSGGGIRAAKAIKEEWPETELVVLASSSNEADLYATLGKGVSGYCLKDEASASIARLVRRVLAGDTVISDGLVASVVKGWRDRREVERAIQAAFPGARLSPREGKILELMALGLTTSQIGRHLVLADVTVRTHVAAIVRKLDVRDRREILHRLRTGVEETT